ncbi:MAG: hypothetical protein ACI8PT_000745 [Gammaproteobacteria bacterium]|jgi:hypothetical protein
MFTRVLALLLVLVPLAVVAQSLPQSQSANEITVYKSPTCGCCAGWAEHLRHNGFHVTTIDQYDLSGIKAQHGITPKLQSCHTAIVNGYAIEGHVPASDILRLLKDRPKALGLTAPGMPMMSPGMSSGEPRGYDVLLFGPGGETSVYSRY